MLHSFDILVIMIVIVFVIGWGPQALAQQPWKTFYSPEFKFAFDYPNNHTTLTDRVSNGTLLDKLIETPLTNFIIKVENDTKDPQEVLVALSQNLSSDYDPIQGGVKPITVDWVPGYMYDAIGLKNGGVMITIANFEHNGHLYTFMVIPLKGFDRPDTAEFIKSIKFFD